jgi:hypothetical protein
MLQVEIQGDWINVRDELAAFIVLKKNGWGVQKEQVRCARCVACVCRV